MSDKRPLVRGFTLVEAVVVMAIVGVLAALGFPALQSMLAGVRVRAVAEKTLGALQLARAEAAKQNRNVTFQVDAMEGGGWSIVADGGAIVTAYSGTEGATDVLLSMAPEFGPIVFDSFGRRVTPPVASGAVTLGFSAPGSGECQPSGTVRCLNVLVSVGGSVRMCDPAVADGSDPRKC